MTTVMRTPPQAVRSGLMLRVWAPNATGVELVTEDGRVPMDAQDGGWYGVAAPPPGTRYRYSLDGGDPVPDPRSARQPEGVHGPSATVDHGSFAWTDMAWRGAPLRGAVLYELHVGTFTPEGTFDAAIAHLDQLVDLGITAIELLPVAAFPGRRGWGYDGVGLFAVHEPYGGPDGLKRLVDACHGRGLGVVMDVVYNHLGPDGNHLAAFGPYFTDHYRTPWGDALNYDGAGSDEVRRFMVDNALMWLRDYHCDGLRLDAVHAIMDTSAVHLLEDIVDAVRALEGTVQRSLWVIAESDLNDPRLVTDRAAGGFGLDAQWSDDLHHALHTVLTGERGGYYEDFGTVTQLATALRRAFVYAGERSRHRGRRHGRVPSGVPGHRFLAYLQNHDQVGNRATGERSSVLVDAGQLRIGAALVLLSPFTPMLFMGEEWGARTPFQYFTDHTDAELGRAVSEGRRREFAGFGWSAIDVPDPQHPATAERSRLDWQEREQPAHAAILDWHRRLLALRRAEPALADDALEHVEVGCDEVAGWLWMRRGPVVVACAFSGPVSVTRPDGDQPATVLAAWPDALSLDGPAVELPAHGVLVWRSSG